MIYHTGFHPLVIFTGNRDHDKSAVTAFYFTKILQKVCEGNYWDDDRNDAVSILFHVVSRNMRGCLWQTFL